LIYEVKIYSAAFTPEQAAIEYNNGKTSKFGSLSTASDGINTSNSTDRSFCIPGDTANCNPPITYWDFNENSGTSANEKTGTGYVGSLSGHSWVPGKYGSAIEFKSGNQLSFGSAPLASPDSKITYTAWFKRKSSITSKRVYLFNNKTTWNAQNGWWIDMEDDSDPNVNRALQFGSSGGQFGFYFVDPDTVYPLNEWVHLAASFDEDTDDVKLYVNGVSVAVTQGMAWPEDIYTSTDTATMGGGYNGTSEYELDDVKIYNYVRTPAQIAWDYNRGAPIAWYKFDECTGTTINDWGPNGNGGYNGNTGTLTIGSSGSNTTYGSCGVSGAWNDGITGKFGASMDFDGTDDYVDLGDMTTLEGATQASWSFWVKPTTLDTMKVLLGKFNADNTEISWIIETDHLDS